MVTNHYKSENEKIKSEAFNRLIIDYINHKEKTKNT